MDNNLKEQERKVIESLLLVKEDYQKTKEQLAISIRKDLLIIELKDIIKNNNNFQSLKEALENYITDLEGTLNGKDRRNL